MATRLTQARFRALLRKARPLEPGRRELWWQPSAAERRKHPELLAEDGLGVELHEVEVATSQGQTLTLYLITTLAASGQKLAALYGLRFNVETDKEETLPAAVGRKPAPKSCHRRETPADLPSRETNPP